MLRVLLISEGVSSLLLCMHSSQIAGVATLLLLCRPWSSGVLLFHMGAMSCYVQVEDCLESPNVLVSLTELSQSNVQQLSELSDLVGEVLTAVERCIMIALITTDVHNR